MNKKTNLNLVYDYLLANKKPTTLLNIWNEISKDVVSQKKDEMSVIADLYGDMVLDNRFALTSEGLWALSADPEVEDIKKQYAAKLEEVEKKPKSENDEDLDDSETIIDDEDLEEEYYDEEYEDDEEDDEGFVTVGEDDYGDE
ncbi:DNA-directed RNA polymerase subunit delta [Mycoplasma yeatsii]|uniref:RNAP delta factor n=1 Tax=Mycoplasma yeatsii TaxID=51365 RepID=A0ABU0NE30_9MOLU|nr:DNA-directed RNA polymerase subunit delta [Mycoplasma yeatsii]AJM72191.1 DNA-directed RNA polymerase subunit delta [Mycoplasma yeatsii GM274B]MDQ0567649.1 DNA-directed RNA polymerase subunit delta [Mycoplasma yeatsii]